MGIVLTKGEKINLSKEVPHLNRIAVALGWDANSSDTGTNFDLDASVFMLNDKAKIPTEKQFIFYNNLKSPCSSVTHTGDNLTGQGDGDDETINVDLAKITADIKEIVVVVTIHEAEKRKQNFGQVTNSYIRLYDNETKKEIAKYELCEDFSRETAVEFGRFYLKDNQWRFIAVGKGYNSGLQGFLDLFFVEES